MISLQACKCPSNCRTQPILKDRKILLKNKNGPKRCSQSHFCGFAKDMITNSSGEKQTDLSRDQTMAGDEEVLPLLQWMGYFTTKFDAHLLGN